MSKERRFCKTCGRPFLAPTAPSLNKNNRSKHCSRSCAARSGSRVDEIRILSMRKDNLRSPQIAKQLGCSVASVCIVLKRHGLSYAKAHHGDQNGMFGRGHTPEVIAQLSKSQSDRMRDPVKRARTSELTLAAIAQGKFGRRSKLEDRVGVELRRRGIDATPQYCVRGPRGVYVACVDFFLSIARVALEVNGTFWHADPRFYNHSSLKPAQRKTLERYELKRIALNELGIRIVEIWESDIERSMTESVDRALMEVANG